MKYTKKLKVTLLFFFGIAISSAQNFKTIWRTTVPNEQITIPTTGAGYNYTVNWGDGTSDVAQTGNVSHTYIIPGDYTVTISGTFPRIYFNNGGDKLKIRSIEEWGSSMAWTNMNGAFYGCINLVNNATDTPNLSGVTDMYQMLRDCESLGTGTTTNWNSWNISSITNIGGLFADATNFNKNISSWDTSNVTNMEGTFGLATSFNQDIGGWDVSNVINMRGTFLAATNFNQDIGSWDTSKVTDMYTMFYQATSFNQNIGGWDVSNVTNMQLMFLSATLSTANYDALLISWNALNLQSGVSFHAGSSQVGCQAAKDAKANMMASDSWTITDGGDAPGTANICWIGATNTDWATGSNWDSGSEPTSSQTVVITDHTNNPIIGSTTGATVNNITITNGALIINSGGSLIVNGTSTGNITYKRALSTVNWYLISSPFIDQDINTFTVTNVATNDIATSGSNYAVAPYNNNGSSWTYFTTATIESAGNFISGKGYSIRRNTLVGDIEFIGTMPTSNIDIAITEGTTNQFNLIGNPYPSYIPANTSADGTNNILTLNSAQLSEETIWFWDQGLASYVALNQASGSRFIAPSQGFFVSAKTGGGTISFIEAMQSYQTDSFQRTTTNRFEINVTMTDGVTIKNTEIYYINGTTTGFDNGYDSSIFGGSGNEFAIYTQTVSNNQGDNLAIQSLPDSNYENMVVPIGVNATAGTELTFTADTMNIPTGYMVFLEDRDAGVFTRLDEANSEYKVTLTADSNNIGRFYLHTPTEVLNVNNATLENISVFTINKTTLRMVGLPQGDANVTLFSLLGKQVMQTSFNTNGVKDITLPMLARGVYVVQLATAQGKLTKKIIIE